MARKELTPEEIADAERVAKKHGWNPEHVKYFRSLPDNLAEWDKKELSKFLKNRDTATAKAFARLLKHQKMLFTLLTLCLGPPPKKGEEAWYTSDLSLKARIEDLEKAVRELCRGGPL